MNTETTLPEASTDAGAGAQEDTALPVNENAEQLDGEQAEQKGDKPEKHPLEKELAKERRRINRIVEQREQARAEAAQMRAEIERLRGGLQSERNGGDNADDADVLKIPRSELPKVLERLKGEADSEQENRKAVQRMAKELGDDFRTVTNELAEIIPSADLQFAVAASEAPAELARYLIDPDNADEAERIARMSPLQAGRALAKIEAKLAASKDKPQPSKAPKPVEPVRGAGSAESAAPANMEAYMAWANKHYSRK